MPRQASPCLCGNLLIWAFLRQCLAPPTWVCPYQRRMLQALNPCSCCVVQLVLALHRQLLTRPIQTCLCSYEAAAGLARHLLYPTSCDWASHCRSAALLNRPSQPWHLVQLNPAWCHLHLGCAALACHCLCKVWLSWVCLCQSRALLISDPCRCRVVSDELSQLCQCSTSWHWALSCLSKALHARAQECQLLMWRTQALHCPCAALRALDSLFQLWMPCSWDPFRCSMEVLDRALPH